MILVAGATGLVGGSVCHKLAAQGETVRALVRVSSNAEKTAALQAAGIELAVGDLKDPASLAAACRGVDAVIATASCSLSQQPGDSILSVDQEGMLHLVKAARDAGVKRFVYVSFRRPAGSVEFPLAAAKARVEEELQDFSYTIVQASWFQEVWLSPALGFDAANATARIYGDGTKAISWVSLFDVAEMCAVALGHPAAERKVIEFGGPAALTPLEVVERFEQASGKRFQVEHVPVEALRAQFDAATDPMQKSFAGLMLRYAEGDAIEMADTAAKYGLQLKSVEEFAQGR